MNDAAEGQDAIATYGKENIYRLIEVKHKYDASGTFNRLLTGGFKLPDI